MHLSGASYKAFTGDLGSLRITLAPKRSYITHATTMGGRMGKEASVRKGARTEHPAIGEPLPQVAQYGCIYLDYNATTPVFCEVADAMMPYAFKHFGNPSSGHIFGRNCKEGVDRGRSQVAALVGATTPEEIHFTSGGTESDNWAIWGTVSLGTSAGIAKPHVVTSQIEHPAVLCYLREMEKKGVLSFSAVPVDTEGLIDPAAVASAITSETVLVTIMHSNNEVGSIQPIADIASEVRNKAALLSEQSGKEHRVYIHTDAAQSLGKVTVDVQELGVDMATIVGHKFGAPKGVGALYIRSGISIPSFLLGGGQEFGRRAGTESVLLISGLGRAAELAKDEATPTAQHMQRLRDRLQEALSTQLEGSVRINGPTDASKKLPNTLSISIRGLDSSKLLSNLADKLAASAGAACHSHGGPTVSSVLAAMNVPLEYALGTLRLSVGRHTTTEDVDEAVKLIVAEASAQGVATATS